MDYQKLIDYRNTKNIFCIRLGILVQEVSPGYARVTKEVTAEDLNPLGVPHGGVYFTMADTAAGTAMASHGNVAVTLNSAFNFLRSGKPGDHLTAEAREIKSGRTVCVYDVSVTDQDGTLLANGLFTFYRKEQKLEL